MTDAARYPIATLEYEGVLVWFSIGDREVLGFVKFTRSGRPVYRAGTLRKSEDLPKHARPALWRPVDVKTWPEPLPEPATVQPEVEWGVGRPRRSNAGPEPTVRDLDRWPYPHVELGKAGVPPVSVEEIEARVLRAMRAVDELYRDRPEVSIAAWPKDLLISAAVLRKMLEASRTGKLPWLRDADYRDVHIDLSDLSPRPARWMPTRRDVSDLEAGILECLNGLPRKFQQLFRWRSANPQYSFGQIAEMTGREEDDVRADYRQACARLFEASRIAAPV